MFSRFFIDRPIFAAVLSIVISLGGLVSVSQLPVAQYPRITPPSIIVSCTYPGASAKDVAESIAAPIEQQVNGVEDMIYMASQSGNDGSYTLTVTFKPGVNLDFAQVLVQNRVNLALPQLPDVVKQTGLTTRKRNPDILLIVSIYSPHHSYDQMYLSNYATIQIADELKRVDGVGDVFLFGQMDYSMRVWLDPDRLSALGLTAGDVVDAVRQQNFQVCPGRLGQRPSSDTQTFEFTVDTIGRLTEPEQFEKIIIRDDTAGRTVRVKDVGHVSLGTRNQDVTSKIDGHPCTSLAVFQLPYANAITTADRVRTKMDELKQTFPDDVDYAIAFDTTPFVRESILEVFWTLGEAILLVAIVVLIFLQNWRSTLIPLTAVPVAILGTFAAMAAIGFSLNMLTLFGLVLAIGIVVDDAIVVVEAVEHHIENGLSPRNAARKAMEQVSGPVIAVALVLSFVFLPCAFISGITGQFFRQFALTIAVSTVISAFNSLTLSPALAALLLQPHGARKDLFGRFLDLSLGWFFRLFNWGFTRTIGIYTRMVGLALRLSVVVLVVYGGLMLLTVWGFTHLPTGYIPNQDQARLYAAIQLPDAASLARTEKVADIVARQARRTPGCSHSITVAGQSFVLSANGSNFGNLFITLDEFDRRRDPKLSSTELTKTLDHRLKNLVHLDVRFQLTGSALEILGNSGVPEPVLAKLRPLVDRPFRIDDLFDILDSSELKRWQDVILNQAQRTGSAFDTLRKAGVSDSVLTRLIALLWEEDAGERVEFVGRKQDFVARLWELHQQDVLDDGELAQLLGGEAGDHPDQAWVQDHIGKLPLQRYDLNARVTILGPPPVSGLGSTGGFKLIVEDRSGDGDLNKLQAEADRLISRGNEPRYLLNAEALAALRSAETPAEMMEDLQDLKDKEFGGWVLKQILDKDVPSKDEQARVRKLVLEQAVKRKTIAGLLTVFRADAPQLYVDLNRAQCQTMGVNPTDVFTTLEVYLGSLYVNDFNKFGRTWQVVVQAEGPFRNEPDKVKQLKVRNANGGMVPLGAVLTVRDQPGPLLLMRYNMYPAAAVVGNTEKGISSGEGIDYMKDLADQTLSPGMAFEWTEINWIQIDAAKNVGNNLIFPLAVIFVFLVLAAQYESWGLPLAVILVVPMCILGSLAGVWISRFSRENSDINIFTQIGFVVLVGLASKNAILIVEFARHKRETGLSRREATLEACRLRLRPILMTSFAFILGVVPLMLAKGAGAEMRQTLGTAVFSGMLAVTLFGIFLTPVFFYVIEWFMEGPLFSSERTRRIGKVLLFAVGVGSLGLLWLGAWGLGRLTRRPLPRVVRVPKLQPAKSNGAAQRKEGEKAKDRPLPAPKGLFREAPSREKHVG
jgi:multidrug efflux pump subunit AcrB